MHDASLRQRRATSGWPRWRRARQARAGAGRQLDRAHDAEQRGVSHLRELLGEDEALLDSRSPVANASQIKAKVMLIHGEPDARWHAERMRDAL